MQTYNQHYKMIKDCLADLCRCIAPNITDEEIAILARGAIVPQVSVRTSVLQSISADIDMSELDFSEEIWLACHDDVDENVELGRDIWEESGFEISTNHLFRMLSYLNSLDKQLRRAAARSLAESVKIQPSTFHDILDRFSPRMRNWPSPEYHSLMSMGCQRRWISRTRGKLGMVLLLLSRS